MHRNPHYCGDHHHAVHPGPGHNHIGEDARHLHSHVGGHPERERAEEIQVLAATFIDGFRKADDKPGFLRLAGIPAKIDGEDGLAMHLVDATIESKWQLGTASPAFASRELVYLPYPGAMVRERETLTFTYVSLTTRSDIDLLEMLERVSVAGASPGSHHHD